MSDKLVASAMLTAIIFIIIFMIIGNVADTIGDAGDAVTDANNCSSGSEGNESLVYNISDGYCYNVSTGSAGQKYVAGQYDLPLNSLFGRGGIILLCLMVGFVIFFIKSTKFKN